MDQRQINSVRASFNLIAPYTEVAAGLFYKRLFKLDPSLRHMFKGDLKEQGGKLMSALTLVVANLDNPEKIVPAVQQLGRRHAHYGVTDEHYNIVADALIWTLRQALGPDFTSEVEEAWVTAFTLLASVMKEAAAQELATIDKAAEVIL